MEILKKIIEFKYLLIYFMILLNYNNIIGYYNQDQINELIPI